MSEKEIYLIVGLGNMGEEYAHTRHNAGFDTLEKLTNRLGLTLRKKLMLKGMTAEYTDGAKKIILCAPTTFMNASGECVERLLRWFDCPKDHLLVIYDDIDLPPGRVRMRASGGPGTHNGMRSIVDHLGDGAFPRLRVGTGDRPAGQDLVSWVLGRPEAGERERMDAAFTLAADCALEWVRGGCDAAMRLAAAGNTDGAKG